MNYTSITDYPYYAVVSFGANLFAPRKLYYRSLKSALKDAKSQFGGTVTNVRILGCRSRREALEADISSNLPIVRIL